MANNRRLLTALIGWAAFSVFFGAWLLFSWGGIRTTQKFDDMGEFVVAFVAAAACVFAAGRHQRRTRIGWALICASGFAWGAGGGACADFGLPQPPRGPLPC